MQTYDAFFVLSVIYLNRMKGKGTQLSHCLGTAAPDIRKEMMREIESQRRSLCRSVVSFTSHEVYSGTRVFT